MVAQNNAGRRAFADVSNTKDMVRVSRDDCDVGGKPALVEGKSKSAGLSQPAHRPMALSGNKSGIDSAGITKPMNPAGKAQPPQKLKRTNAVFKDELQPVPEKATSKETNLAMDTQLNTKETEKTRLNTSVTNITEDVDNLVESEATASETEEAKHNAQPKDNISAVSEPEEWDEDDTEYHVAPAYPTDATTSIIYPCMSHVTTRQMFQAKAIVESQQTAEDIEEDFLDTTMVAEYGDEIFLHLRKKEVCSAPPVSHIN